MIIKSGSIVSFGSGSACEVHIPHSPAVAFQLQASPAGLQLVNLAGALVSLGNQTPAPSRQLLPGEQLRCGSLHWIVRQGIDGWELSDEAQPMVDNGVAETFAALADLAAGVGWEHVLASIPAMAAKALHADAAVLEVSTPTLIRHAWPSDSVTFSQTAIRKAMESGEAVLWAQDSVDLSRSMVAEHLTGILVAPFHLAPTNSAPTASAPVGYLYLQRAGHRSGFDEAERKASTHLVRLCATLVARAREDAEQLGRLQELRGMQSRGTLVWACEAMEKAVALATKVGPLPVPVIVRGETGTGKEAFARLVHNSSPRADKPFVPVNCGAIPSGLMESILFGHAKGAFTGANETRKGVFEEADGGTLFLDEIGELPLDTQVKLLRVLQERKFQRVGDPREIPVDVRIIAATHRDLEADIKEGKFREDLYFRIQVMALHLPALRERGQDVLLLAERFLARFAAEFGMPTAKLSSAASKAMLKHGWPGNVRELENRVQKALVQCEAGTIQPADLGLDATAGTAPTSLRTLKDARDSAERECASAALRDAKGNLTLAASILGIDRKVLRDLLERLGISKDGYRE